MAEQVISLVGAGLILFAYAAQQMRRLATDHLAYILLNLLGASILAVIAYRVRQTGLTLVEASWALISAAALIRYFRRE